MMTDTPFLYSFRFCCDPDFNGEQEADALMRYAAQAAIDDVAVFVNVQELNTGHLTFEQQKPWLAYLSSLQKRLGEQGVTLSVNNWHSLMHADLGKTLARGQDFRRMVDVDGREASLCVCPLCTQWQDYFCELYARYAVLEPHILWVEDDFRFHNHLPLAWGGCFCEEHMRLFAERAGRPLSRAEFVRGVLQPGPPHPYRAIWLDVCRETMSALAGRIGQAVREVSANTKTGLMSSSPHVHAAEGRDWHGILYGLAAGRAPVDRIHLPGYIEPTPQEYITNFNMISMLTRHFLPGETEIYPELENYPYSLYTKSRRFTRYQLLSSLPLRERGITIDLYDLNGNGIVWEEGYQQMLRETKGFLCAANGSGAFTGAPCGVRVMCSERASYSLHTQEGASMEELYPQEVFFAGLLPMYGIPFAFCSDQHVKNEVLAVSGQYFRSLTEQEIRRLFADNVVILNGDALDTLLSMGLGELAGVRGARWATHNGGEYTFEQVSDGTHFLGRAHARASAVISASDVLLCDYAQGVHEYSAFYNGFYTRAGTAQASVDGRVWIFPFGHFAGPLDIPPMLKNSLRAAMARRILHMLCPTHAWPMVQDAPWLIPYCFSGEEGMAMYLVNASTDAVETVSLLFPCAWETKSVRILTSEGEQGEVEGTRAGNVLTLPLTIGSMESALLWIRENGGNAQ